MKKSTIFGFSRLIARPEAKVAPRLARGAGRSGSVSAEPWRIAWTASQAR